MCVCVFTRTKCEIIRFVLTLTLYNCRDDCMDGVVINLSTNKLNIAHNIKVSHCVSPEFIH